MGKNILVFEIFFGLFDLEVERDIRGKITKKRNIMKRVNFENCV